MSKTSIPQVNLAVLGARGVGKSTFIKCALDLKQFPTSRSLTKKMSLDGVIYLVRLVEIALNWIAIDDSGRLVWPRYFGEQDMPGIDGVLALFDSTDPSSVTQFPRVFSK
jgi:hypothetical protein